MQQSILLAMCALAGLTFLVLLLVPIMRFIAAARREVTAKDFALGESSRVPDHVRLPNRNLANLLETPVLFYVVCLALIVADRVTPMQVHLAWVYVATRVVHTAIHITVNFVPLRIVAFAASVTVLIAMWALFAMSLMGA